VNEQHHPDRLVLALCAGAALVEGFDTQSMGVAAPRVIAEFGLSAGTAGIIFSAATVGLFVGAAIGGRMADYFGRKRALIVSLLLFGLFSLITTVTIGPKSLFVARAVTGLGLGGAMPNFISLASESTHADRRVSTVTIVMAGMPLGGALSGLVALGAQLGLNWRSIFYIGGTAPIVLAIAMMRWLPRARDGKSAQQTARVESVASVLFGSGRAPTTLLLWGGFFFTQLVLLLMLNWLPSLIIGLGFTHAQASWASVCFNVGGSLGASILGYLHAGNRRRVWMFITYMGMAAALAAVASVGNNFAIAALACALSGVFIVGAQLILFALAPLYYETRIRGTGVGAAVAIGRAGSIVGPLFAGSLLASGGSSAGVLFAIVPFVALGGSAAFALTWRKAASD
jgi:MFS transporter, AAHS family, 3-hydroxyphenylpropionic acid transporter